MNLKRTSLCLAGALCLLGCRENTTSLRESTPEPSVTKMTAGELDKLINSLKGKVVLVNYWATWCGPCRLEIPGFIKLQNEYGPKGLQIVGLSIDTCSAEQFDKFVGKNNINYPVHMVDQDAARKWGDFEAIPMTFVLDTQGKKVWQHEGYATVDVFENQIKLLLPK